MRAYRQEMYRAVRSDSKSSPSDDSICSVSTTSTKSTFARSRTPSNASEVDKENKSRRNSMNRARTPSRNSMKSEKFAHMRSRAGTTTLSTSSHLTVGDEDMATRARSLTDSGLSDLTLDDADLEGRGRSMTMPETWSRREGSTRNGFYESIDEAIEVSDTPDPDEPVVEFFVCNAEDLKENEIREFEVENHMLVLIRNKNGYYALPSQCPFCMTSLKEGILTTTHIRCGIHGSAYNLKNGELEDGPGFDSLYSFPVKIQNDQLLLVTQQRKLQEKRRVPKMVKCTNIDEDPTIIIGSGPAALTCAETLRKNGYNKPIVMITKENVLPYDRKKLSKRMKHDIQEYTFRNEAFFLKYDIQILLQTTVNKVDFDQKTVHTSDGKMLSYTNLVLAMGSQNKLLKVPGTSLDGIYYLRDYHDAEVMYSQIKRKHVTIVGNGFEGLEICSTIDDIASSVTLLGRSTLPLKYLGPNLGREINQLLYDNGINVRFNSTVRSIEGYDHVSNLILNSGMHVIANTVVICRDMTKSGYVIVDGHFKTNAKSVYAVGDVAEFSIDINDEENKVKLPFWQIAQETGKRAALSILDKTSSRKLVPFLWIDLFKKHITFCGDPTVKVEETITRGKVKTDNYVSYFFKNEENDWRHYFQE